MNFLFLLIAIGLIVLKAMGKLAWSWLVVGSIAFALFLLPNIIAGGIFATLFKSTNRNTNDPSKIDSCGCGPGQAISLSRRNIFGKYIDAGLAPCEIALTRIKGNRRYRINGCVN